MPKKRKTELFLVMWDMLGLECVVPISPLQKEIDQYKKEECWRVLANQTEGNDPSSALNHLVNGMILRAKFNSQRHYEIYSVNAVNGITEKDIEELFNQNPQAAADLIRERGTKIYSDRMLDKHRIIT